MIELKNIHKQFIVNNKTITALNDVSLTVNQGEIFGVIGVSGAGKSTLIRCVNLLERPSSGNVVVDGDDLTILKATDLTKARQKIAMIFQHFNLLSSKTVFDNIALPLVLKGESKQKIKTKVLELVELVGLSGKEFSYPANLSGGQKQRVAIARALAADPKVLLCDEATSALDPSTTNAILQLLKEINQRLNLTILLITHEMEVIKRICDKVAVIEQGVLVEQGSVSEIFADPKTEIARKFIKATMHHELPEEYLAKLYSQPISTDANYQHKQIVKFEFTGQSVDAPLLSMASQQFGVNFSILMSHIDYAGGVKFGFLIVELIASTEKFNQINKFLTDNKVATEVLGYVG